MIKINLLPQDIEKKAAKRKKGVLIAAAVIIAVGAVVGMYLFRAAELSRLNSEIAEVDRELRELQPVVEQVRNLEESREDLDRKIEVIEELMQFRLVAPVFMEDLAAVLPFGVWFDRVRTDTQGKELSLEMNVMARDNYASADFLNALEMSDRFESIRFTGLTTTDHEGKEIRTFNLRCRYLFKGVN